MDFLTPVPLAARHGRRLQCSCRIQDNIGMSMPIQMNTFLRDEHNEQYSLPLPALASSNKAHHRRHVHNRTSRSTTVMYFGSMCLSIVAAAFTLGGNAPMPPILIAATVFGAVGSIFVAAALLCDGVQEGRIFIVLSMTCSAMGTVCVIAGIQDWMATTFTCVLVAMTVGAVLVSRASRGRRSTRFEAKTSTCICCSTVTR
ncbi:hypothetical protein PENSPDRAFT_173741 [Peniophora sp. CONT]|nr:hypothetical protein PENSPDRAFT_173741 [Peniophora sp. CONT]